MRTIILVAHNIRSIHNVGSLLRTADGLGVKKAYLTGYTPYPQAPYDTRLPHLSHKIDSQIHKTALGAERTVAWEHRENITAVLSSLKKKGYILTALEQSPQSTELAAFVPSEKVALLVGREVEGIEPEVLVLADHVVEIPMLGQKESFNVVVAAAIALYHCRYFDYNR